ncbi:MAG: WecB/TagA/CpsF family glycosyltransferase [Acidobacteriota bacterium]
MAREDGGSRYVCCAAVNNVMEARDGREYAAVMEGADLVTSDGMPLVWALRAVRRGGRGPGVWSRLDAVRVAAAEREGVAVAFYGGTDEVLGRLRGVVRERFAGVRVVYAEAPPFRAATVEEDERTVSGLRESVRGSCLWGSGPRSRIGDVCASRASGGRDAGGRRGVRFFGGREAAGARWMQQSGTEWAFRLATEPRRLWRRYLKQNPRFALLALAQILRARVPS